MSLSSSKGGHVSVAGLKSSLNYHRAQLSVNGSQLSSTTNQGVKSNLYNNSSSFILSPSGPNSKPLIGDQMAEGGHFHGVQFASMDDNILQNGYQREEFDNSNSIVSEGFFEYQPPPSRAGNHLGNSGHYRSVAYAHQLLIN
jgi:hypothetical protein